MTHDFLLRDFKIMFYGVDVNHARLFPIRNDLADHGYNSFSALSMPSLARPSIPNNTGRPVARVIALSRRTTCGVPTSVRFVSTSALAVFYSLTDRVDRASQLRRSF
jgi:hypothetical protein